MLAVAVQRLTKRFGDRTVVVAEAVAGAYVAVAVVAASVLFARRDVTA